MEELGGNSSSSMLSASIVSKFKTEFEKSGLLKFTSELERKLTECVNETLEENKFVITSSPSAEVDASMSLQEPAVQETLPPLIFHFEQGLWCDSSCYRESDREAAGVIMGMMKNGKPEILEIEHRSTYTIFSAGSFDDESFQNEDSFDADNNCRKSRERLIRIRLNGIRFLKPNPIYPEWFDLKELGLVNLSSVFYNAFLIRKLKIAAESQCDEGSCQVAILATPMAMQAKCVLIQRHRLKEAAVLAGFKEVYLIPADGLFAYYWFHEKVAEMEENNYSNEFVAIQLFGNVVVYQKSIEAGIDGKEVLVVKAVMVVGLWYQTTNSESIPNIQEKLKTIQKNKNTRIPVISRQKLLPYKLLNCNIEAAFVKNDESDDFKYFAAKGAALLSENPGNLGRHIMNMLGTTITFEPVSPETDLPVTVTLSETSARLTVNCKHAKTKYRITQFELGQNFIIGYLAVNGVKHGAVLEVTFELSSEGIWKVVGVSARNPDENDRSWKTASWDWVDDDERGGIRFGSNSYEECKSLLLKFSPSPEQVKGAVSGKLPQVASSSITGGSGKSQEKAVEQPGSSTNVSGDQIGTQKEKGTKKGRVIRPNDIIVNTTFNKIQLESDWVAPVVKVEQDSMEGLEEDGNDQQQQEIVVKVEDEDVADQNQKNTRKRRMMAKEKVSKNRKQQ